MIVKKFITTVSIIAIFLTMYMVRAPRIQGASIKIAYIYSNDVSLANDFKTFLEANGYTVDLVSMSQATTWDYNQYCLILIGSDTGYLDDWGDPDTVSAINNSGKPIIGLGEGGYAFFGKLGLTIGWPHGWHGSGTQIYVVDPSHRIFNWPNKIDIPPDKILNIYTSTRHVGIHLPSPPPDVVLLGRESYDTSHYILVQEKGRYLIWGFTKGPTMMTQTGKDLFINIINWLCSQPKITSVEEIKTKYEKLYEDYKKLKEDYNRLSSQIVLLSALFIVFVLLSIAFAGLYFRERKLKVKSEKYKPMITELVKLRAYLEVLEILKRKGDVSEKAYEVLKSKYEKEIEDIERIIREIE